MRQLKGSMMLIACLACSPVLIAQDDGPRFHEDYYLGFSQGAYYGLMLAGTDYQVAWCMKSELAYEGRTLGTGEEFQSALESILKNCRAEFPADARN
jgi:hypothetical protein